jgi:hypothetical protein
MRPLLLALLALLLIAAPVRAASVTPLPDGAVGGPVLAGDEVAWVAGGWDRGKIVRAGVPGRPSRDVFATPRAHRCEYVERLTASPGLVAFVHRSASEVGHACGYPATIEAHVRRTDGTEVLRLEDTQDGTCLLGDLALQGTTLAVTRINCPGAHVMLHDLGTGAAQPLLLPLRDGEQPSGELVLAGRHLAVRVEEESSNGRVLVFDRVAEREVVSVDMAPWLGAGPPQTVNIPVTIALQPDATVAVLTASMNAPTAPPSLVWASPEHPQPTRLVVGADRPRQGESPVLAIGGDRIAVPRFSRRDVAVIDLAGRTVARTPAPRGTFGVDFDGRRLVVLAVALEDHRLSCRSVRAKQRSAGQPRRVRRCSLA